MADPYKVEELHNHWYVTRVAGGVHIQKSATYAQAQALREQLNDAATLAALALTSDVHYVDVVLDPVDLTTGLFLGTGNEGENGYSIITAPGPGLMVLLERVIGFATPGDKWIVHHRLGGRGRGEHDHRCQ